MSNVSGLFFLANAGRTHNNCPTVSTNTPDPLQTLPRGDPYSTHTNVCHDGQKTTSHQHTIPKTLDPSVELVVFATFLNLWALGKEHWRPNKRFQMRFYI
nr:hypothetical protein [Tanacetum cinerariifolium]